MESGSKITTISNNTIFYQDTLTLVAASNKILLESNDIIWTQQDAINDSDISNISEAIIDTTLSTSKLNLDTLLNGYYTVIVKDNNSTTEQYVVGVFKTENIIGKYIFGLILICQFSEADPGGDPGGLGLPSRTSKINALVTVDL